MSSTAGHPRRFSRRIVVRSLSMAALGVAAAPFLAACGTSPPPAAPSKPAEPAKPAEAAKPAAPAADAKPTAAAAAGASAAKPAAQAGAGVELRLHVRTGNEADTLADRLPELESKTGIKSKIESFPGAEYHAKLQTLIAGGQMGDVFWTIVHQGWGPYFMSNGVGLPLDPLIDAEKFDMNQYYPAAVQATKIFENKILGLPFKLQPFAIGIYYNATAFEEEKVTPPTTETSHAELIEISKKMTKTGSDGRVSRFGFFPVIIGTGYESLITVARNFGSDVTSADGKKATINTPETIAGVKYIHDLVFQHKASPRVQELGGDPANPLDSMFVAGTGAMFQSGSWSKSLPTRVKDKFEVKNTLMPLGPAKSRGSMAGVDVMMINKATKNQKESWELVKLLCDKETGIRLGEGRGGASGTCGGRPDAFNDPRLLANPLHPIWIKAAEEAGPLVVPANFRGGEIDTLIKQKLGGLFNGDEKFEQKFFDDLNGELQQILDKPKP